MIVWQLISFQSIYHAILNAVIFQYMRKLVRTFEILRLNDFFEIKLLVMGIGNWNLMFFASCSYCIAKTHRLHFWSHTPFFPYANLEVMKYSNWGRQAEKKNQE